MDSSSTGGSAAAQCFSSAREASAALRHIQVRGAVLTPGDYDFHDNCDVMYYLNQAGTLSEARPRKVSIVRRYGPQSRTLLFRLDHADQLPKVRKGDILVFHPDDDEPDAHRNAISVHTHSRVPALASVNQMAPAKRAPAEVELFPGPSAQRHSTDPDVRDQLESYIRRAGFKRLLNQMASAQAATGIRSIAIISKQSKEGKSFLTAALALGYARYLDSRVLIIDTNRGERSRSIFTGAVSGEYSDSASAQEMRRESSFIDLYTTDMLEKHRGATTDFFIGPFIQSVQDHYDVVFVDTCSMDDGEAETIDPIVVASQTEAAILVTSPRSGDRPGLSKMKDDLKRSDIRLLGTVYNPGVSV